MTLKRLYCLFVLEAGSRYVRILAITTNRDGLWTTQQRRGGMLAGASLGTTVSVSSGGRAARGMRTCGERMRTRRWAHAGSRRGPAPRARQHRGPAGADGRDRRGPARGRGAALPGAIRRRSHRPGVPRPGRDHRASAREGREGAGGRLARASGGPGGFGSLGISKLRKESCACPNPAVWWPASSPFVVSAGGTRLRDGWAWNPSGNDAFTSTGSFNPACWGWTDGGPCGAVWDESWALIATGGGASVIYARPSWQQGGRPWLRRSPACPRHRVGRGRERRCRCLYHRLSGLQLGQYHGLLDDLRWHVGGDTAGRRARRPGQRRPGVAGQAARRAP